MKGLPSIKSSLTVSVVMFMCAMSLSGSPAYAQGIFGGGGGGGIFGGIADGIRGFFDNFGIGVPGGSIVPGVDEPTGGAPVVLPGSGLPPINDPSKKVKLTLEWDALSVGGEAVSASKTDPLKDEHIDALRCPPCPNHLIESQAHKGEKWHYCAIQLDCSAAAVEHTLYGWCGQKPKVLNGSRTPGDMQLAYEGPNTYTLPSAVSNKYVRRDGYAYQCVRDCDGKACMKDNYMEFQTMIYDSNAVSLYIRAENLSDTPIDHVVVRVSDAAGYVGEDSPLPHNLDYPISTSEYLHANNVDDYSAIHNGIPVKVEDGQFVIGPFYLPAKGVQEVPLQTSSSEIEDVSSAQNTTNDKTLADNFGVHIANWIDSISIRNGLDRVAVLLRPDLAKGDFIRGASAACGSIDWGVNVDPANPAGIPSAESVGGASMLRIEFKDCTSGALSQEAIDMYNNMLDAYKSGGNSVNMIIDYSSMANANDIMNADVAVREAAIAAFVQRAVDICNAMGDKIDSYEIWNEPDLGNIDGHGKPILPPFIFGEIVRRTSDALEACDPSAQKISGGLASGDWGYLDAAGPLPASLDAIGIHPYGKTVGGFPAGGTGDLATFLNQGLAYGLPVAITEMGLNTGDQQMVAEYMAKFGELLNNEYCGGVSMVNWFSWSDGMVPNFGLVEGNGNPKQQYYAYFEHFLGKEPPDQISYLQATKPVGNNCGGGGNLLDPVFVPPALRGQTQPANPNAPWNPAYPGEDVPWGSPVDPPDLVKPLGKGGIVPRDFNFVCDDDDDSEDERCHSSEKQDGYIINDIGSEEFDKYRDTTGIGGCGYWASSNNSVIGPMQFVAEYGSTGANQVSRSVLLASIPIGGRILDDQSRPYGWPASGTIQENWGYTGEASAQGYYRSDPGQEYGEYRCCGSCLAPL